MKDKQKMKILFPLQKRKIVDTLNMQEESKDKYTRAKRKGRISVISKVSLSNLLALLSYVLFP